MYSIVLELVVHEFIVSAFLCLVQRCNNPHKTFFSSYDLTLAKVPHAEIPFQYLLFFFFFFSPKPDVYPDTKASVYSKLF